MGCSSRRDAHAYTCGCLRSPGRDAWAVDGQRSRWQGAKVGAGSGVGEGTLHCVHFCTMLFKNVNKL